MERRDILKASAIFLGYGLVGGTSVAVLNGCKADTGDGWTPSFFSQEEVGMLAEVAERIIPKTDTPGAKDALVHRYLDEAVSFNFDDDEKIMIKKGIGLFNELANSKFKKKFVDLNPEEMDNVIQQTADNAKVNVKGDNRPQIFPQIKGMVAAGFFTSEVGATQALVYLSVPGPYQGCVPLSSVGGTYAL
ncbi:MAG: gluconate 2-dehydrogenase gamma chain [Saprospiraceae bacterium]|jgi:hypothetical protein